MALSHYCNCFTTDLQKNLDMEKRKFEKVKETLTKTEEEFKDLKKVWFLIPWNLQSKLETISTCFILLLLLFLLLLLLLLFFSCTL